MATNWKKKLKPSAKPFAKISSANTKIIEKVVPKKLQKPALRAANVLESSNLVKTSVDGFRGAAEARTGNQRRAALRRYHFNTFLPGDKRTKDLRTAETMINSDDVATRQRGYELRDRVDSATLRHGRAGIAVAGTVVGGAVGGAGGNVVSKAAAAGARDNPTPDDHPYNPVDTWPDPSRVPDVQEQMYRGRPVGAPGAQQRTRQGANGGGLLSGIVNGLWNILVPKQRPPAAGPAPAAPRQIVAQPATPKQVQYGRDPSKGYQGRGRVYAGGPGKMPGTQ